MNSLQVRNMKQASSSRLPHPDYVIWTVFFLISSILLYFSLYDKSTDTTYNIKRGAVAVVVIFVLIVIVLFHIPRDGPFVRPHPIFWNFVLCTTVVYTLVMLFTLFQSFDDIQRFLRHYDPNLGVPLPEKMYAEDCRIYTPGHPNGSFVNIMDKMDEFVPSHFFGWYFKAIIGRDWILLHISSLVFELVEYTLECQLPNFGECWWDHPFYTGSLSYCTQRLNSEHCRWILDFVLCNGLGIYCGLKTLDLLSLEIFDWKELWKKPQFRKRYVQQTDSTDSLSGNSKNFINFVWVFSLMSGILVQELNLFYLKTALWLPPNHHLNLCRQLIYGFAGICAGQEMFPYVKSSDPNVKIRRFSWMCFFVFAAEILVILKFGWNILAIPLPTSAIVSWSGILLIFSVWIAWEFCTS